MRSRRARATFTSFALSLGLLVSTNPTFAEEPAPSEAGRSKIRAGVALMIGGAVVTGIGAAVYVANENAGHTSCAPCANTSWVFPTVIMAVGGAMFLGGAPLFVIGEVETSRATIALGPTGATFKYSF